MNRLLDSYYHIKSLIIFFKKRGGQKIKNSGCVADAALSMTAAIWRIVMAAPVHNSEEKNVIFLIRYGEIIPPPSTRYA